MARAAGYRTKNSKPKQSSDKETEICKKLVDRLTNRRTFEPFDKPVVGCRFHRFRIRGESVTGQLGFPIPNFRQGTSYPMQLDSGEIVEIIGNKLLHKQIREGKLYGRRVKIVYQGREFRTGGHCRKIYRVFKIEPGLVFTQEKWNQIIIDSQKRRSKNGRRK